MLKAISSPFPFSPIGASLRELPDLWKGRRFKLHYRGMWREGQVCGFRQYNPTPTTMMTKWTMEVELDTIETGDQVEFVVSGMICDDDEDDSNNMDVVKLTTCDGARDLAIKPNGSRTLIPRMKLQ